MTQSRTAHEQTAGLSWMTPLDQTYSSGWSVADEKPTPDDSEHRALKTLGLTVAGCCCRRCCNLRDISIVGLSPIEGYGIPAKDELVARAQYRINARSSDRMKGCCS